jgi:hypothetical protein
MPLIESATVVVARDRLTAIPADDDRTARPKNRLVSTRLATGNRFS